MIKCIRLARARAGADAQQFRHDWRRAVDELAARARPDAAVVGFTPGDEDETCAGISMAWFGDETHLARAADDGGLPTGAVEVLVVDEEILRGEGWLAARAVGDTWHVHMALAPRAPGLSREKFRRRWREHARPATNPVPEELRGLAYVQNHPRGDAPPYDAVNEAHFDDPDALGHRLAYFAEHGIGRQPDGLFGAATFLALRVERLR